MVSVATNLSLSMNKRFLFYFRVFKTQLEPILNGANNQRRVDWLSNNKNCDNCLRPCLVPLILTFATEMRRKSHQTGCVALATSHRASAYTRKIAYGRNASQGVRFGERGFAFAHSLHLRCGFPPRHGLHPRRRLPPRHRSIRQRLPPVWLPPPRPSSPPSSLALDQIHRRGAGPCRIWPSAGGLHDRVTPSPPAPSEFVYRLKKDQDANRNSYLGPVARL